MIKAESDISQSSCVIHSTTISLDEIPTSRSGNLRERAHRAIPGGCHTYAKGDDQYPVNAPAFIARGRGCHVWDVEGREYIEYAMGLRSTTLGH